MLTDNILEKLKQAKIVGRGGAAFPTHLKWQRIKEYQADQKYVICNASEGEPGVQKDYYLLQHYPEDVFKGMRIAMDFLETKNAYLNINADYYQKLKKRIDDLVESDQKRGYDIKIYIEKPSYIGGETGSLLNSIEGKREQPRHKPPSPSLVGLFGKPTLLQNVETFYDVALVASGKYTKQRLVTITGKAKNPGVFYLDRDLTVKTVLYETGNVPDFPFFVQVGGKASGRVVNQEQIDAQPLIGCGSIDIIPSDINPRTVLEYWFNFYMNESCGKCTPCREGSYQLVQLMKNNQQLPWPEILEIVHAMKKTSFCQLGQSLAIPVESYLQNVLFQNQDIKELKLQRK